MLQHFKSKTNINVLCLGSVYATRYTSPLMSQSVKNVYQFADGGQSALRSILHQNHELRLHEHCLDDET